LPSNTTDNKQYGHQLFDGRKLVIATMHHKEKVLAPELEKELGVKCSVISNFNTDQFGMFSGEIERKDSPFNTVRAKALAALELSGETLAIASEGSFGPHPAILFVAANEELVMLIDTKHELEIVGRHLTVNTNFNHREITNLKDLDEFADQIAFPSHGIIIKIADTDQNTSIYKDIKSTEELHDKVQEALDKGYQVKAETDMRAMHNPTRMQAIEQAVLDLIKNIASCCPKCNAPGFVIKELIPGLACESCRMPTKSAKAYRYECQKCAYSEERPKVGIDYEDAMYCDFCNP
jgi:hypothetical protein